MKKNLKGFTLVEVLIVIIIVGILIAALLPRLLGAQGTARDTARKAGVNQIAQAVAVVLSENGTITGGNVSVAANADITDKLATIPVDPQTPGNLYTIAGDSTNGWIVVSPALESPNNGNCTSAGVETGGTAATNYCTTVNF